MNFLRITHWLLRSGSLERYDTDKHREMEARKVSALVKRVQQMQVPPTVARELGLADDWKKRVSPAFVEKVAKIATRHEKALKELSKY